jgi:MIR domain
LFDELRLKVELSEIQEPNDKVGETEELSSFGLWKIEAENVQKGGDLRWDQQYRLKHLLTGMYLAVEPSNLPQTLRSGLSQDEQNLQRHEGYRVCLRKHKYELMEKSTEKDKHVEYDMSKDSGTLFEFRPIENLLAY